MCDNIRVFVCMYHHGEDDGSGGGLDHPQQHQAGELGDGEQVHLPQGHVAQVDEVGLVLGWHAEQLDPVKELRPERRERHTDTQSVVKDRATEIIVQ